MKNLREMRIAPREITVASRAIKVSCRSTESFVERDRLNFRPGQLVSRAINVLQFSQAGDHSGLHTPVHQVLRALHEWPLHVVYIY